MSPRVLVTSPIYSPGIEKLRESAQVEVWTSEKRPTLDDLCQSIHRFEGMLTLLNDPIQASLFDTLPAGFKGISQMAVGYDNIDLQAATRRGIPVYNTPGVLTETTADFTWALLMAAARRVCEADREVHQGVWRPWGPDVLTGYDVSGSTLGIIGFGRIGQAVARRAAGFGMRILYNDPSRDLPAEKATGAQFASLDELLGQSDFISLHTYLSPGTYHLIGAPQLSRVKPNAILINTARGGIVDPQALEDALRSGRLAGAALDVTEPEPIPQDSPLLQMPNVIITPHIASASKQTRQKMAFIAVDNLLAALQGSSNENCLNPAVFAGKRPPL